MIPTYRATAQQLLLLQAALLPGEAGRAAWQRVRASVAFDALDGPSESVLPLVYRNVARFGDGDPRIEVLKDRYVHTWSENQRFYHCVLPLLQAFQQVGIDAVVL